MARGGFPGGGNMAGLMKQAQKMQAEMARVQEELKELSVSSSAGGGMVKVTMTGDYRLTGVEIDPAAIDPDDLEMLQDTIVAAVNDAMKQAMELSEQKMGAITGGLGGGLGIPGF